MLAAVLASVAVLAGIWFYFESRAIDVWVYTDHTFRYNHPNWSGVVESRFREVNRIYQRNGTGIRWKVLDSSQTDPTSDIPGLDNRRTNMALHLDRPTDIFVIFSGVQQNNRTGSVSPFTRVAVIVDYPDKSELINARLLAHELAHLFGVPHEPAWLETLMGEKPESATFSPRTVSLIKHLRNYPFELGIDGLLQGSWEKKALTALAADNAGGGGNAMAHAHTVLGTALINERKNEPALVHFRAAVQADPRNKTMRLNLAEAYTRNSQYDLALEQAREVVRLAPDDPLAHRALGALLGRNHQPEAAVQELQTAIRLEPKNPQNEVLLGIQLAGMFGHLDDAVAALEEATRVDPDSALARKGLEKAQTIKERVQDALVKGREQVQKNPNDPDVHYRLAKVEARAGDLKGAIRDFEKAAELRPGNGTPHLELAEIYLVQGDSASAWAEVRKARALGADPPQSLIDRLPPQN